MTDLVPHRWNARLIVGGKEIAYGGVHALPKSDPSRRYDNPALEALVTRLADAEFGAGNYEFASKTDPYKLNASPASDHGL